MNLVGARKTLIRKKKKMSIMLHCPWKEPGSSGRSCRSSFTTVVGLQEHLLVQHRMALRSNSLREYYRPTADEREAMVAKLRERRTEQQSTIGRADTRRRGSTTDAGPGAIERQQETAGIKAVTPTVRSIVIEAKSGSAVTSSTSFNRKSTTADRSSTVKKRVKVDVEPDTDDSCTILPAFPAKRAKFAEHRSQGDILNETIARSADQEADVIDFTGDLNVECLPAAVATTEEEVVVVLAETPVIASLVPLEPAETSRQPSGSSTPLAAVESVAIRKSLTPEVPPSAEGAVGAAGQGEINVTGPSMLERELELSLSDVETGLLSTTSSAPITAPLRIIAPLRLLGLMADGDFEAAQITMRIIRPLAVQMLRHNEFRELFMSMFGEGPCQFCPVESVPCRRCVERVMHGIRDGHE